MPYEDKENTGVSQKGYDAEILSLDILEKEGFEIIYSPETSKRERIKVETEEEEMELEKKLESFGFSTEFVDKNKKIHRGTDKRKVVKFKEKHLTSKQKNQVELLIKKWEQKHKQIQFQIEKEIKFKKLLSKIIGDSIIPESVKENHRQIIEKEKEPDWKEFTRETLEMSSQHTFIDIFCKKRKDYYIFDVKHKTFKENKNLNRFYVTNYEVLNYSKIIKENKVKLKIIIIVDKGKKSFYKIFDWMDFHVPTSFDPHKSVKTSIRLKDGLDLVEFKVFLHS